MKNGVCAQQIMYREQSSGGSMKSFPCFLECLTSSIWSIESFEETEYRRESTLETDRTIESVFMLGREILLLFMFAARVFWQK